MIGGLATLPSVLVNGFICGCGHSGTTLIANILASHPDAYVPLRETGIFKKYRPLASVRYRILLRSAVRRGKTALIKKTPRHIHHLDLIRKLVPGARFVMPVRDGRDSAASFVRRNSSVSKGIKRWILDNTIVLAERNRSDVLVYRHEDLIDDPPGIIRRVCEFFDLEYSDRLLDYHRREQLWFGQRKIDRGSGRNGVGHNALRNWQVNQPIFDSRGRWRNELSDDDIAELIAGRGRPLMEAFGYL